MKLRRFFCALIATVLTTQLLYASPAFAAEESLPDTGWFDPYNVQDEYVISTAEQLMGLASLTQTQFQGWSYGYSTFEGIKITLANDIHLESEWIPVGASQSHPFAGTFDGAGYTISNVKITESDSDDIGIFGYVTGSIENLNVTGSISSSGNNSGGIAGTLAGGTIFNCMSEINVSGNCNVGGIAGESVNGTISNCINRGDITGNMRVGGIVGENRDGKALKCINEGDITSNMTGIGTYGTGGICGRSVSKSAEIRNCHNKGNIFSKNECSGGIAGYCNPAGSAIIKCTNSGSVEGIESSGGIAGSTGENGIIIKGSYNLGKVNGHYSGGILGKFTGNFYDSVDDYITDNYYSEVSSTRAVGLDKNSRGKRNYTRSILAKSHSYLESSRIFTQQKVLETGSGSVLEQIDLFNKHYFVDLFSNGEKNKGDFIRNAAEHLQIIN